jgi:hypothetical protein
MIYWTGWVIHIGCLQPSRREFVIEDGGRDHQANNLDTQAEKSL